ncbi:MAG: sensor histidine kinase, partial [Desulfobacterales bacterium]|nr:sensor histidine kinase [Desulfobacterales bacterium]
TKLITTLLSHISADVRKSSRAEIVVASHTLPGRNKAGVTLIFRDNGIPTTEKDMVHLFDPFYAKKQMGHPGSGLGLTAVKKIMEDHGGKAIAGTCEGKGLQITLLFPRENKPGNH